jgi:hypothetical protein
MPTDVIFSQCVGAGVDPRNQTFSYMYAPSPLFLNCFHKVTSILVLLPNCLPLAQR